MHFGATQMRSVKPGGAERDLRGFKMIQAVMYGPLPDGTTARSLAKLAAKAKADANDEARKKGERKTVCNIHFRNPHLQNIDPKI